ncbi:TapB family protein [Marinifilum caeruleilacunae]|jgi:hypothetical protein|uniref:DUF3108 domain-containing protein n=1 Tax=Marinifilum caeruleilacunae TaxID=2499076 RepID=A0ABX1X184_9BACT|nr:hypothetical protein [Marinifilum caeruleilacunae]NOU62172.1 hypothetical protein [Marinifilum caeruleilacunae]
MKKIFYLILILLFTNEYSIAQECTIYIPNTVGTELHYEMTNQKGKVLGAYTQKLLSIKNKGDETIYSLLQTTMDGKSDDKILMQDTITFRCKGNEFYIDMDQYMNDKQMEAFQNMEVKVVTDDLNYPANLSPGQKLKDGSITVSIEGGMMNMSFTTNISNRKVEARENMDTPAGSFKCYKLSEDIQSKTGFVNVTMHNVMWISKDIGTIRSESYNKKGKLTGITQLVKIVK